jgi:DnaK suppressor protein
MEQEQTTMLRKRLEDERAALEKTLAEYGASPGEEGIDVEGNDSFADSGQATAERSQALAMVEGLQEAWKDVTDALKRIEGGTYGKCERCGNDIPFERLEARPAARLCVTCKQRDG